MAKREFYPAESDRVPSANAGPVSGDQTQAVMPPST